MRHLLRCVLELRLSHRFLSLWGVRRWRLSPHGQRNLVRILRPFRLHLRICPIPPQRLSALLARAGVDVWRYWLMKVLWLCQYNDKELSKSKTLAGNNIMKKSRNQVRECYMRLHPLPGSGSSCSNGVYAWLKTLNNDQFAPRPRLIYKKI